MRARAIAIALYGHTLQKAEKTVVIGPTNPVVFSPARQGLTDALARAFKF